MYLCLPHYVWFVTLYTEPVPVNYCTFPKSLLSLACCETKYVHVFFFRGKKGFGSRRLILFTDLGGPFGDQELDTIVAAMSNTKTELNVM